MRGIGIQGKQDVGMRGRKGNGAGKKEIFQKDGFTAGEIYAAV